jgi:hypothetical protein
MNKGKEDFILILNRFTDMGAKYDKLRKDLQNKRSQPEEMQINAQREILSLERQIEEVEAIVSECIERLKLGMETLTRYTENMKEIDHILLTCLRGDQVTFQSIFETVDVLKDLDLSKAEHNIKVYELKIKQRQKNKNSSNIKPVGEAAAVSTLQLKGNSETDSVNTPSPAVVYFGNEEFSSSNNNIRNNNNNNNNNSSRTPSTATPSANQEQIMQQIFLLQQDKKELHDKVIDLERQLHQKKVLFDNSCKERRKLTQELDELTKKLSFYERGGSGADAIMARTSSPSLENAQIMELNNRIIELETMVKSVSKHNEELTLEVNDLKLELKKSEDALQNSSHNEQKTSQMKQQMESVSQELAQWKRDHAEMNKLNQVLKEQVSLLEQEKNTLVHDNVQLRRELEENKDLIQQLKESNVKLEAQVEDLKSDAEKNRTQLKSMRKKLKRNLSKDGSVTPRTLTLADQEMIRLERKLFEMDQEQTDYRTKYEELQEQFLALQRKQSEMELSYENKLRDAELDIQTIKSTVITDNVTSNTTTGAATNNSSDNSTSNNNNNNSSSSSSSSSNPQQVLDGIKVLTPNVAIAAETIHKVNDIVLLSLSPSKQDISNVPFAQKLKLFEQQQQQQQLGTSIIPSARRRTSAIITPRENTDEHDWAKEREQLQQKLNEQSKRIEALEKILSQISNLTREYHNNAKNN